MEDTLISKPSMQQWKMLMRSKYRDRIDAAMMAIRCLHTTLTT
jgi:hypothetical protein